MPHEKKQPHVVFAGYSVVVLGLVALAGAVSGWFWWGYLVIPILVVIAYGMWKVEDPEKQSPAAVASEQRSRRQSIPEKVRHEVWRRDQGRCVDCNSRERLEFDHVVPISRGGSNTARNIELRCEVCNRRKAATI